MIALLGLPRGEGIPWPEAEESARNLRSVARRGASAPPAGIVILPGTERRPAEEG